MKKKGLTDSTLHYNEKALNVLQKNVSNLDNAEEVKGFIAQLQRNNSYKRNLAIAYNNYCKYNGINWEKPKYYCESRLPKIPSEEKINMIISNCSRKLGLALSISKDTGMRPIEVMSLRVKDTDCQKGICYPNTAKHGSPRCLKLKETTVSLLQTYLAEHQNIGLDDRIFGSWSSDTYGKWFRHYRNKLAAKLCDVSLKQVTLYSLRHRYATMLYYRTKDILLVKQQLGHRKIETTLIYTQLVNFSDNEEYYSATAKSVEEAAKLVEQGFEYVTEFDAVKLFRKRK
jgi:integrase